MQPSERGTQPFKPTPCPCNGGKGEYSSPLRGPTRSSMRDGVSDVPMEEVLGDFARRIENLESEVAALKKKPKRGGATVTEQQAFLLHAEFDTMLGAEGVEDQLAMALDHPSAKKYPNTVDIYLRGWLKRAVSDAERMKPRSVQRGIPGNKSDGINRKSFLKGVPGYEDLLGRQQ